MYAYIELISIEFIDNDNIQHTNVSSQGLCTNNNPSIELMINKGITFVVDLGLNYMNIIHRNNSYSAFYTQLCECILYTDVCYTLDFFGTQKQKRSV